MPPPSSTQLSDRELLDATVRAARDERRTTAALVALLSEVDARRLYLGEGCASLFSYCTRILHLSEHAAYHRIEAARELHHILPFAAGGPTTVANLALRCRAHNGFESEQRFGPWPGRSGDERGPTARA